MSVLSDLQASIGFAAHQGVNGDAVERRPKVGDPETGIVGVWLEYSEDRLSSQRPDRQFNDTTDRVTRHGLLQLPVDQTVADTDTWIVLGEAWQVQRIGAVGSGYRELYLQRDDKKRTAKYSPHRL